jgi:hypothetical protein
MCGHISCPLNVCILDVTNDKDEDDILMRNAADDDNDEEDVHGKNGGRW